ncbi:MAG: RagB/SusD family nutrient uptake outer membrane protein [Bacteroidales bacterium]|nr:RagB/SusD family nutrient uptake outer membrane protein [Bacteroidales bacterium]
MKLKNILILTGAALTLGACSDFLVEDCQTGLPESAVFQDMDLIEQNLVTIYNNVRGNYVTQNGWLPLSVGTDETQSGAYQALKEGAERRSLDYGGSSMNSTNTYITQVWNGHITQIAQLSKIIRYMLPQSESDTIAKGSQREQLLGECCFLRGSLAMELVMLYGRIPVHDYVLNPEQKMDRKDLDLCWEYVFTDLQNAANYCPLKNDAQRATRYAGLMMLARAYMSAPEDLGLRDWEKATECLKEVCEYGPYDLVNDYADLYDYTTPNTKESIFEWQFSPTGSANCLQWLTGSRAAQGTIPDEGEGCLFAGYDHCLPTEFARTYESEGGLWEEGDQRYDVAIRTDFTHNGYTANYSSVQWEGLGDDYDELEPHIKKYEDPRNDVHAEAMGAESSGKNSMYFSGKNICWLRFGDACLLYAECLNEIGDQEWALEWVNFVRQRGFGWVYKKAQQWTSMSKDEFRSKILDERIRELICERWRRFDLLRTGNYPALVTERNKWANRFQSLQDYNKLFPIPYDELSQNEDMDASDQNPGY